METIPLAPVEAIIPDHDAEPRDDLEPEPELDAGVLVDPETPTAEELDPNSIVAYDIAEYDTINQVLEANKSSPSLEPLRQKAREQSLDYELANGKLLF